MHDGVRHAGALMPELACTRRFFESMRDHGGDLESEIAHLLEQFLANSRSASLDLESYHAARDPRFRTIRLTRGLRGILWSIGDDQYVLDGIATHDEAERIARRRCCTVDELTGQLRIVDVRLESDAPQLGNGVELLFDKHRQRELVRAGISQPLARVLKCLQVREDFEALMKYAPLDEMQIADAVLAGFAPDEAREYAALHRASAPTLAIVPNAALAGEAKTTQEIPSTALDAAVRAGGLVVVRTEKELREALRLSFADWGIFLHPSQREYAYRPKYNGPFVLVGGPGTGKTVVALHRTSFLARALAESSTNEPGSPGRILFCAFSASLVESIRMQLERLCGPDLAKLVDVATVDAVATRMLKEHGIPVRGPLDGDEIEARIVSAIEAANATSHSAWLTPGLVQDEWEHVILGNLITRVDEYVEVRRQGAGRALSPDRRRIVWDVIQHFESAIADEKRTTFPHNALRATLAVRGSGASHYAHIVVDEAQDLSAIHWRLLRSLVANAPNDMFIVGDAHQRIYSRGVPLKVAGIQATGRRKTLVLNYRNTMEIIDWALQLAEGGNVDDLDDGIANLDGYHARMNGPAPECVSYGTREEEYEALVASLRLWAAAGIKAEDVAIMCRSNALCDATLAALQSAGVSAKRIRARTDRAEQGAVSVLTMHRSKGLEFRAVQVVAVCEGIVPQLSTLDEAGDNVEERARLEAAERKLLFTACTRPRERLRLSWHGTRSPFLSFADYATIPPNGAGHQLGEPTRPPVAT